MRWHFRYNWHGLFRTINHASIRGSAGLFLNIFATWICTISTVIANVQEVYLTSVITASKLSPRLYPLVHHYLDWLAKLKTKVIDEFIIPQSKVVKIFN